MRIDPNVKAVLKKKILEHIKGTHSRSVEVISACALEKSDIRDLQEALPQLHDADIQVTVDPSIIGGIIIKDGSKIIDMSMKESLHSIVTTLTK